MESAVFRAWKRRALVVAAPVLLLPLPLVYGTQASRCGLVVLLMAVYWTTEALPLAVTGLLPVVLLPSLGIVDTARVCSAYTNEAVLIGMGSIMVALAVEECRLHERMALLVLRKIGTTPHRLLMGFMISSMFIAMWIGPTPVMAMMIPIMKSVLDQLRVIDTEHVKMEGEMSSPVDQYQIEQSEDTQQVITSKENTERDLLKRVLLLGVCYSTNIGGTGTIPATAPNLVFKTVMESFYPRYDGMTFTSWMLFNLPGMLVNAASIWLFLVLIYVRKIKSRTDAAPVGRFLDRKYSELGRPSFREVAVLVLFALLAALWLFRRPQFTSGWQDLMPGPAKVTDATSTLCVAALLFLVPAQPRLRTPSASLLEWKTAQEKMPWGVFLLLGGGFALADGAKNSGFSDWLSSSFLKLDVFSPPILCLMLCLVVVILIEVAGNTATATVLFPVIARMAAIQCVHPLFLMLPSAVCSSFAFVFPVSSAPNAIIFENFRLKVKDMVLPGLLAKIICLSVTFLMITTLGNAMFEINTFPDWAKNSSTCSH